MAHEFNWQAVSGALRMGYIARRKSWGGETSYLAAAFILSERDTICLLYPGKKDGEDSVNVVDIHGWFPTDEDKAATDWEIRGTPGSMTIAGTGEVRKNEAG